MFGGGKRGGGGVVRRGFGVLFGFVKGREVGSDAWRRGLPRGTQGSQAPRKKKKEGGQTTKTKRENEGGRFFLCVAPGGRVGARAGRGGRARGANVSPRKSARKEKKKSKREQGFVRSKIKKGVAGTRGGGRGARGVASPRSHTRIPRLPCTHNTRAKLNAKSSQNGGGGGGCQRNLAGGIIFRNGGRVCGCKKLSRVVEQRPRGDRKGKRGMVSGEA